MFNECYFVMLVVGGVVVVEGVIELGVFVDEMVGF